MRRADREITDRAQIDAIIRRSQVCRLGMVWEGEPYVVPLCFGYDGQAVYLHMASAGKKLLCLRANPRVCLEWDLPGPLISASAACGWGMAYESVIAYGLAEELRTQPEKQRALEHIMEQYAGSSGPWTFSAQHLAQTVAVRVRLGSLTGKARP